MKKNKRGFISCKILSVLFFLLFVAGFIDEKSKPEKPKWFWQLQGELNLTRNVDIYDVDLFEVTGEEIRKLHERNITVICYFSAGTVEEWRDDAGDFPTEIIGKKLSGWEGEKWLDIRKIELLQPMIDRRIALAKEKGCDGIEPDNLDGYNHNTGFEMRKEDAIKYAKWLAKNAHEKGLLIALKNCGDLVNELVDYFDLAIVEECFKYNECEKYIPFVRNGKPVLEVEYEMGKEEFCRKAKELGFSASKACYELNGCWDPCWN